MLGLDDDDQERDLPVQALLDTEYEPLLTEDDLVRGYVPIDELAMRVARDQADDDIDDGHTDDISPQTLDILEHVDDEDDDTDAPIRSRKSPPLFKLAAVASIVVALLLLLDRWARPSTPTSPPAPTPPTPPNPAPSGESRSWSVLINTLGYHLDGQLVTAPPATAIDFLTAIKAKPGDELLIDTTNAPSGAVNDLIALAQSRGMFLRFV